MQEISQKTMLTEVSVDHDPLVMQHIVKRYNFSSFPLLRNKKFAQKGSKKNQNKHVARCTSCSLGWKVSSENECLGRSVSNAVESKVLDSTVQ